MKSIFYIQNKIHQKKGFTLIEALVSLGIFSVVVVAATGVILSVISSNKKNQAISSVVNNLNYSIESMVRDIKTGYKYQCTFDTFSATDVQIDDYKLLQKTCASTGTVVTGIMLISTITGKEQIVKYQLKNPGPDAYLEKTVYVEDLSGNVTATSYPLTDKKNISIQSLVFNVKSPDPMIPPSGAIVLGQPGVFLTIKGTAKVNQINISDFFIQTYISQRLPNFI